MSAKKREGVKVERSAEVFLSIVDPRLDGAVRRALMASGHRTFPVPGGESGWKVMRELRPQLLILEAPEGDLGQISLLERMERNRQTRSIPVLVFTKDLRLEFRLRGVYEFFHDYDGISRCMEAVEEVLLRLRGGVDGTRSPLLRLEDYRSLEEVTHLKTGITLRRERAKRVERALRARMEALGMESFQDYVALLRQGDVESGEWKMLIPALTVEETSFFRTVDHFRALEEVVVPKILARKAPGEPIRVWCAGCSSGEEAYTVAICLRESISDVAAHPIQVIASDINEEVLGKARRGGYSERAIRKIPEPLRRRYFVQRGAEYYPEKTLRRSVVFKNFNLQGAASSFRTFLPLPVDVIFCRNVVIYFRKVTIQRLVERFHSILAEDGYLFLGYSETLYKFRHRFRTLFWRETFFYQRHAFQEDAAAPPAGEAPLETPEPAGPDWHEPSPALEPSSPAPVDSAAPGEESRVVSEEKAPDPYRLLAAGDCTGAERIFRRDPEDSLDSLVGRAYVCLRDGRTAEAEELLERIQGREEVSPQGYYISGLILQSKGNRAEARREYERAIYLDDHFYPGHVQLAELLGVEGRVEEAIRSFRNGIQAISKSDHPYLMTLEGVFPSRRVREILEDAILEMEEGRS